MLGFCGEFLSFPFLQNEWRAIGVQQSRGWVHYAIHRPEPHIMLFRRPLNYQAGSAAAAQRCCPSEPSGEGGDHRGFAAFKTPIPF